MKKIVLKLQKSSAKDYPIFIGNGIVTKIANILDIRKYSKAFIVTDQNIKPLFLKNLQKALPIISTAIVLAPGERGKGIKNVEKIWKFLASEQGDRKSLIINLGGGVIGDMGGFAASTFMRGVDFINVPTTLLSQVDASVGGKTGIDFAGIKNLIGTFNQPVAVIVDISVLSTLPKREFLSGFGEIIKHGLILDKKHFERATVKNPLKFSKEELKNLIHRSIQIKAKIVEIDETENGIRKILNFGHTIGHAVEILSLETKAPLLHGEAVSIGMMAEAKISYMMKLISLQDLQLIEQALINAELPISIPNFKKEDILRKMQLDKKRGKGQVNLTLLKEVGEAIINQNVDESIISKSL